MFFVCEGSLFGADAFLLTRTGGPLTGFFVEFFFVFGGFVACFVAEGAFAWAAAASDFPSEFGGW